MSSLDQSILITRPISLTIWTVILCIIAVAICSLLYFAQYTRKHSAQGILVPDKGLVNIITPDAGLVVNLEVTHGQAVKQGQLLYKILSDKAIAETELVRTERRNRLASMEESLQDDIVRQENLNQDEVHNRQRELHGLQSELLIIQKKIQLLDEKIVIAENNLGRYEKLVEKNLFSKIQAQEKRMEYLDTQAQKAQLQNERDAAVRQIEFLKNAILMEELRGQSQLAALQRKLDEVKDKLLEYDSTKYIYVIAPGDGIVANISAKAGQHVDSASALLSIIPDNSQLFAELYAPSNAIGFVSQGDKVLLRYRAFPYQKFGQHEGIVRYISRASLSDTSKAIGASPINSLYKITVALPEQHMVAYGRAEELQAGMEIDADILLDKRRLYEWLFEPLLGISRKQ